MLEWIRKHCPICKLTRLFGACRIKPHKEEQEPTETEVT